MGIEKEFLEINKRVVFIKHLLDIGGLAGEITDSLQEELDEIIDRLETLSLENI